MAAASIEAGEVEATAGAPNIANLGPTKEPCEAPIEGETAAGRTHSKMSKRNINESNKYGENDEQAEIDWQKKMERHQWIQYVKRDMWENKVMTND